MTYKLAIVFPRIQLLISLYQFYVNKQKTALIVILK